MTSFCTSSFGLYPLRTHSDSLQDKAGSSRALTYNRSSQNETATNTAAGKIAKISSTTDQTCSSAATEIRGIVYEDLNCNGRRDVAEDLGLKNIIVTATDSTGNTITTTTDNDGNYAFTGLASNQTYRIDFSDIPNWAAPSSYGTNGNTKIQFTTPGSCANFGMAAIRPIPAEEALALTYGLVATCAADEMSDHVIGLDDVLDLSYSSSTQTPSMFTHADWTVERIGNLYFTEFDDSANIYGPATKFTGYIPFSTPIQTFGTLGGSGTVYRFDAITGAPAVWATLPQEGNADPNDDSGLGGITYYYRTRSIYVVNMFDHRIYQLDINGNIVSSYLPDPATLGVANSSTSSGDTYSFQAVPFGLDTYNGRLYYTVHDGTGGGSMVVRSVELDDTGAMLASTDREEVNFVMANTFSSAGDYQADPVSADIDFSREGKMALGSFSSGITLTPDATVSPGFSSWLNEASYYAFGDTETIYNHTAANYIFEYIGGVWTQTAITSVGQNNFSVSSPNASSTGGVAWDIDDTNQNGDDVLWMSGGDFAGEDSNWGVIGYNTSQLDNTYDQEDASDYIQFLFEPISTSEDPKGNGGDVDVFHHGAVYLELGHRIWLDENRNGVQDAKEPPLENVRVELYNQSGELLAFDVTDSLGYYFFSGDDIDDAEWQVTNGLIEGDMTYYIVAGGGGQFDNNELSVNNASYILTINDNATGSSADEIDSDAVIASSIDPDFDGKPYIETTTSTNYKANHSLDFGFYTCTPPSATVSAQSPSCSNGVLNEDGELQISAMSGDRFNWSVGNSYTGDSSYANATDVTGLSLPIIIADNLENPNGTQEYTVRIFDGLSSCFADIVVSMQEQNIPTLAASTNDPSTCNNTDGSIEIIVTNVLDGVYTINYTNQMSS
ncbi:MAG: SdrD B-like domain-containing protein, partial [Bacteroidota bacterium]